MKRQQKSNFINPTWLEFGSVPKEKIPTTDSCFSSVQSFSGFSLSHFFPQYFFSRWATTCRCTNSPNSSSQKCQSFRRVSFTIFWETIQTLLRHWGLSFQKYFLFRSPSRRRFCDSRTGSARRLSTSRSPATFTSSCTKCFARERISTSEIGREKLFEKCWKKNIKLWRILR